MNEELIIYLVSLLPSAAAVIASLTSVGIFLKKFKDLRASVKEKTAQEDLKKKLEVLCSDLRELRSLLIENIEATTRRRGAHRNGKDEINGNDGKV